MEWVVFFFDKLRVSKNRVRHPIKAIPRDFSTGAEQA
jgi:hypothetical protein